MATCWLKHLSQHGDTLKLKLQIPENSGLVIHETCMHTDCGKLYQVMKVHACCSGAHAIKVQIYNYSHTYMRVHEARKVRVRNSCQSYCMHGL